MADTGSPPTTRLRVRLWDEAGLGLIVSYPSGIIYSNQTAGVACVQSELEGIFVPLGNDTSIPDRILLGPVTALMDYAEGPKWGGGGAMTGIDTEDADVIDGILASHGATAHLRVDRTRLRTSYEAWVWVEIGTEDSRFPSITGLGPVPHMGVITWPNSD